MNTRQPRLRVRLLHVAVLSALAFVQPLFGMLAANPLFLVVRRTDAAELWAFVGAALLLPAALLAGLECVTERLCPRAGSALHLGLVGGLFALMLAPVFNRVGWWVSVAGPVGTAFAFAYGYSRASLRSRSRGCPPRSSSCLRCSSWERPLPLLPGGGGPWCRLPKRQLRRPRILPCVACRSQ